MHLYFPVAGRGGPAEDTREPVTDPGQIFVVRDPDDESEWQYLGNPQIAARTSLSEAVARFIRDCSDADGAMEPQHFAAARKLRDALLAAASQVDKALKTS